MILPLHKIVGSEGVFTDGDWIESKDQDPDGDVRLIQLADVGDGFFVDKSSRFLTFDTATKLKCTFLEPGDILIARLPDPLGRACVFPGYSKPCITAVDVCILRVKNKDVDTNWLLWYINSPLFRHEINKYSSGTTRKRISRKNLGKINIPLPPLDEQRRIAAILDQADALRQKRRQALQRLDNLLQSVFLEMFGDPVRNEKGWEVRPLENIVAKGKYSLKRGPFGGSLKKEIFVDEGYMVYEQQHAIYGDFSSGRYFIDQEKFDEMKPFAVKPGDFIISCSGTVGRISQVPESAPSGVINQALLKITLNENLINPTFFIAQYKSQAIQQELFGIVRGTGIKNFPPMKRVRAFPFIVPSIALQVKYEKIHQAIRQDVERMEMDGIKLDELFISLQQGAFRGEL